MKQLFILCSVGLLAISCSRDKEVSSINAVNWQKRMIDLSPTDSLVSGETYLSVYSQIYSTTEHKTLNLTATISMRNTNRHDTIYVSRADYFNTKGDLIRTYFDKTIFLGPMETVEIVIDQIDKTGGTGANFLFDWKTKPTSDEPLFECVMISTMGSLGLSFTTQGRKIN